MVKIEYFEIDPSLSSIRCRVHTDEGNTIIRAVLYHNSFGGKEGIDISSFLSLDSNVSEFTLPASIVEDTSGIWFISFVDRLGGKASGVATDLSIYHSCVLNKLLRLKVDGCNVVESSCKDCGDCGDDSSFGKNTTLYSYALLETMIEALNYGYFQEALMIKGQLDELCLECDNPNIDKDGDCGCSHRTLNQSIMYGSKHRY